MGCTGSSNRTTVLQHATEKGQPVPAPPVPCQINDKNSSPRIQTPVPSSTDLVDTVDQATAINNFVKIDSLAAGKIFVGVAYFTGNSCCVIDCHGKQLHACGVIKSKSKTDGRKVFIDVFRCSDEIVSNSEHVVLEFTSKSTCKDKHQNFCDVYGVIISLRSSQTLTEQVFVPID